MDVNNGWTNRISAIEKLELWNNDYKRVNIKYDIKWMIGMNEWINGRMNVRIKGRMKKKDDRITHELISKRFKKWMNEWMNEWINDWTHLRFRIARKLLWDHLLETINSIVQGTDYSRRKITMIVQRLYNI